MTKQKESEPYNIFGLLKTALRAEGVKASHLNQKYPDLERLQVSLPIGKTIHIWVRKNKMLIGGKAILSKARYAMDIANPANDPNTVVEMFKTMCKAQAAFINKCEKLW